MVGKNCVAIASDLRFGMGAQTVAMDFSKVYHINDRLFVGLPGLLSDSTTLYVCFPISVLHGSGELSQY
jgi:20S proteasome subunit beta 3